MLVTYNPTKKCYWFLTVSVICLLLCVLAVASIPVIVSSSASACRALSTCDPFLPICASSLNEHQFFYSQCEMLRDICFTGKDWKTDFFSHCNVSKL
ncbi:hypothetical protein KR074_010262 [Drosophila pseudoananassae]|nr:hypothetical protein KR074_010262 [Drosophila pseudoananassae]